MTATDTAKATETPTPITTNGQLPQRICATGAMPDEPFTIPAESQFEDAVYIEAPVQRRMARSLMSHDEYFAPVRGRAVLYLWKRTQPKLVSVKAISPTSLEHHLAGEVKPSFVVTFSAKKLRAMRPTEWQMEAMVYRALRFMALDKNGRPTLHTPELDACFTDEIERYGAWNSQFEDMARAVHESKPWKQPVLNLDPDED